MKKENKNSDFNTLNDQLGSFNLEPPKIYREEQRQCINADYYKNKEKDSKKKSKQQKQRSKRKLKKNVRNALLGVIVAICTAILLVILSLTVLFKIETITVAGNQKYTTEQIMSVFSITVQSNLFLADTDLASEKLESALPYIYDAKIKRKLPSTITVTITEATEFYTVQDKDKTYILMDNNFKVLEKGIKKRPKNALLIQKATVKTALEGNKIEFTNENVQSTIETVNQCIKDLKIDTVTAIYATDKDDAYIVHDSRITINLGTIDGLEDKLYTSLAAIDKLEQTNPQVEGDLNVSSDKQTYFTERK